MVFSHFSCIPICLLGYLLILVMLFTQGVFYCNCNPTSHGFGSWWFWFAASLPIGKEGCEIPSFYADISDIAFLVYMICRCRLFVDWLLQNQSGPLFLTYQHSLLLGWVLCFRFWALGCSFLHFPTLLAFGFCLFSFCTLNWVFCSPF